MTNIRAFKAYVDSVGGRAKAAKRLEITTGMVDHILSTRRAISVKVAIKVEADSNGFIRRETLLPEIFGPAPEAAKQHAGLKVE